MKKSRAFILSPFMILCILLYCPPQSESSEGNSVIETIGSSLRSVVGVRAENAAAAKGPGIAFKGKESGKVFIMNQARAAQFERTGLGIALDREGIVATNAHTVMNAARLTITLRDGDKLGAEVVWVVPEDDIAFIRAASSEVPVEPIGFSDPSAIRLGADVYTVRSSEVAPGSIAQGKITGLGKRARSRSADRDMVDLIQTSLILHKGDSGGPLLNRDGRLVGILVASQTTRPYPSFAVPSSRIEEQYKKYLGSLSQ